MRILFVLFTIFLVFYQAAPGSAQAAPDTIECSRGGGGCMMGPCRGGSQNVGTCQHGTLTCCRWSRSDGQ